MGVFVSVFVHSRMSAGVLKLHLCTCVCLCVRVCAWMYMWGEGGGGTNNQIIKQDSYAVRENITVESVEHTITVPADLTVHLGSRSSMKTTVKPDIK